MARTLIACAALLLAGTAHAQDRVIDCSQIGQPITYTPSTPGIVISHGSASIRQCTFVYIDGPKDRSNPASTDVPCNTPNPKPEDRFGCGIPILVTGDASQVFIIHNRLDQPSEKQIQIEPRLQIATGGYRQLQTPTDVYIALNIFAGYFGAAADDQAQWTHAQLLEAGNMRVTFAFNDCTKVHRRCMLWQGPNARGWEVGNVIPFQAVINGNDNPFPIVSRGEAQVLAYANVIVGPGSAWEAADVGPYSNSNSIEPRGTGYLKAINNTLSNGATLTEVQPDMVVLAWPFGEVSPDEVPSIVAHAGPQP